MSEVAIRAQGLGKQYRLGATKARYSTFQEQIRKWVSLRKLLKRAHRAESQPPFWALKDVSFEVKRGEVVGVIGRNGAGKSTLLKVLSRITDPTEGEVDIHGRVGSLLEVGTGFHPELTGRENIFLNGAILGMRRAEIVRKFDEIVAFAEVEKFIDTPVKFYSSGMYTRLAFSVAAHMEPEILIVDEVLAVGDAQFQKRCLGKMGEVARGGRTVLFVSHQLGMIETLCQSGLLLEKGRVAKMGPASEVIRAYLDKRSDEAEFTELRHAVRSGSGELQLTGFWTEDETGRPMPTVPSGSTIVLAFQYHSRASSSSRVSLGFSLHNGVEQRVALIYSDYQGVTFTDLPPDGVIRFTLPNLPLPYDSYFVKVRVMVNGVEADRPRDFVGRFDVESGDFYHSGQAFHSGIGLFLIDGHWNMAPSEPPVSEVAVSATGPS